MSENTDHEIRLKATLSAPVELVWKLWTDPLHLENWWGPEGFSMKNHQMDFSENGDWSFTYVSPDGKQFPYRSVFKTISTFKKIVFEHFNPHFLTTVKLKAKTEQQKLTGRWRSTVRK